MSWTEEKSKPQDVATQGSPDRGAKSDARIFDLLEKVLTDSVVEKRRARRWKIFFRLIFLGLLVSSFFYFANVDELADSTEGAGFVAVMPMEGVVGAGELIDSHVVLALLDDMYKGAGLRGVVLKMNSPGGSPVHSGIIYDAIREKKRSYPDVPIVTVVEDMAASGGYYIASATDKIFVDKASLVGSIGVISASFDLTGLIDHVGVERRIFTAGENKAFLDPFLPMSDGAKSKWQAVLDETHAQFIAAVKEGRGDRLVDNKDVFSGMVFTGTRSIELGLADDRSSLQQLLKQQFSGLKVVYFEAEKAPWEEVAKSLGVQFFGRVLNELQLKLQ